MARWPMASMAACHSSGRSISACPSVMASWSVVARISVAAERKAGRAARRGP